MSTVDLTLQPPATLDGFKSVSFADVKVGQEFWWGSYKLGQEFWWDSYYPYRYSWGKKRTSRTADYRRCLRGELTTWQDWGYFKRHERVYVALN